MTDKVGDSQAAEEVNYENRCTVCFDSLQFVSIPVCNHPLVCAECTLRLRIFDKDNKCPYCLTPSEKAFITTDKSKTYESFDSWDGAKVSSLLLDQLSNVYFEKELGCEEEFVRLQNLRRFRCCVEGCAEKDHDFMKQNKLEDHLFKQHKLKLCKLCVEGRKQFICELKRYNQKELGQHLEAGDKKVGLKGHPKCQFCKDPKGRGKLRFFDDDALHDHLKHDHEKCHICEKLGKHDTYYKNREALFSHFGKDHFLCSQPECHKSFTAFATDFELRNHTVRSHPEIKVEKNIKLNFNYSKDRNQKNERESADVDESFRPMNFQYRQEEFPGAKEDASKNLQDDAFFSNASNRNTSSSAHWAVTAGSSGHVTSKFNSSEAFPSLPQPSANGDSSRKRVDLGSLGNVRNRGLYRPSSSGYSTVRRNNKKSPFSTFVQAANGIGSVNLPAFQKSSWEQERNVKSGKPTAKQMLRAQTPVSNVHAQKPAPKLHVLSKSSAVDVPKAVSESLRGNVNALHNLKLSLEDFNKGKNTPESFYGSIYSLFISDSSSSGDAKFNESFSSVLSLVENDSRRDVLRRIHENKISGIRQSVAAKQKLNYLEKKTGWSNGHGKNKLKEEEFPSLGKPASAPVSWGRKNGKLDIDQWLKENAPSKSSGTKNVRIGTKKKSKKKGATRQLSDFC